MNDWFSTAMQLQRDLIRVQQAQMDAARAAMKQGETLIAMQDAANKAAKANVEAWHSWAKLWGWT